MGSYTRFLSISFYFLGSIWQANSVATNFTIDDTFGDSRTGELPSYKPLFLWGDQRCSGCAILPDPNQMLNKTYHEATWNPGKPQLNITLNFSGTAIYVFFTLIGNSSQYNPGITLGTAVNFTLDETPPRNFEYVSQPNDDFLYQSPVFTQENLSNGSHTLVVNSLQGSTYVNFDYATYTLDEELDSPPSGALGNAPTSVPLDSPSATPPSSHPHAKIAIILGATLGSLCVLITIGFVAFWLYRRRNPKQVSLKEKYWRHPRSTGQRDARPLASHINAQREPQRTNIINSSTRHAHQHPQEELEHRVIELEHNISQFTTILSSLETQLANGRYHSQRTGYNGESMMTSGAPEGMIVARIPVDHVSTSQNFDWEEGSLDDLPPRYTQ